MKVKVFSPIGIKPDDYRHKYPEIERTEEFAELSARALIFVWWYANQTSDLVMTIPDDYERAAEALKSSGFNPSKTERESILKLQFDSNMALAIKKMASFDPGIRFRSHNIVQMVFNEYEKLIKRGPTVVAEETGEVDEDEADKGFSKYSGKNSSSNPYFVDRYVVTSARIVDALPGLLAKLEEGFGILDSQGNEVIEESGADSFRDWHRKKNNEN